MLKTITMLRVRQIKEVQIKELGKRIKESRDAMRGKKTLEQICEHVGVSETYWYAIEKESIKGTLSYEKLKKIEEILEVDLGVDFKTPIAA